MRFEIHGTGIDGNEDSVVIKVQPSRSVRKKLKKQQIVVAGLIAGAKN